MNITMRNVLWTGVLLLIAWMAADARPSGSQVWTGTLIDATCYFDNPADTGNAHEGMDNCGKACLELGRPGAILTADKKYWILIAPSLDIAKYVGMTIRVTGRMKGTTILVEKFEVKQGANWQAVRLSSLM